MKLSRILPAVVLATLLVMGLPLLVHAEYFYFAGYAVLQLVVMATAWNLLGGVTGYVNFGASAFFAIGAYTSVALVKAFDVPLGVALPAATLIAGLVGTAMGYLTLRIQGVYFSIATLALSVLLYTVVVNWGYVGGARGAYVVLAGDPPLGLRLWAQWLFVVCAFLAGAAVAIAVVIERSRVGWGLRAVRDDEAAAEALGVPTLRLKLLVTTLSGALMGAAGSTYPYFISYVEPTAAFSLGLSINSIAAPLIGGMQSWAGPVVGAILLGTILQVTSVTWSSDYNLIVIGVTLVLFVTLAPQGLLGLWQRRRGGAS